MNIKQIGALKGSANFMQDFLHSRNIENLTDFLYPQANFMLEPSLLDNMQEGAECYLKAVDCGQKITIVVDSDCDGFTSAAIIYNYTKKIDPNANISWLIHAGKQHGVEDLVETIIDVEKPNLLILPDAGTNDSDYCKEIMEHGINVLILDHHIQDRTDNPAIIINNQSSVNYTNKHLCGAGVVYKFCKFIDSWAHYDYADSFIDLAAMGIIGDMMNISGLENRYIIDKGLKSIQNFLFDSFIEKQSFSMGDKITPIGIAFYIVPLINGMIRVGNQEEKEILFEAFINPMKQVPSTKRGHKPGDEENICAQAVRICANAKNRQDKLKEKISELLDIQIQNYCLDAHKIIIVDGTDVDYDSELTGLIAMQLAARYHKPILLGKRGNDNMLKGSIRNCANSPISDLKEFLLSSELFEYVSGRH